MTGRRGSDRERRAQEELVARVRSGAATELDRRQLLAAGTGAAAALALSSAARVARAQGETLPTILPCPAPSPGLPPSFQEPPVIESAGGVLQYTLDVKGKYVSVSTPGGFVTELWRTYGGKLVGPTLKVRRGDVMLIDMDNQLPPDRCDPSVFDFCCTENEDECCEQFDVNKPHCYNTTNLHTHGLHVSPASFLTDSGELIASDDVLQHLHPGELQRHCIWLPKFHAPGSYWYHAHKHGAVALQVMQGLCGALIVEEDDDERILDEGQADRVWVIQERMGDESHTVYACQPFQFETGFVVNGLCQPLLRMRPGEVQRWRFVNATSTPRGFGTIEILDPDGNPVPMHLIAVDGITFYGKKPRPTAGWVIPPGGRFDVLVQLFPTSISEGFYRVNKNVVPGVPATTEQVLAHVLLDGHPADDELPEVLPSLPERTCYLRPIRTVDPMPAPKVVTFDVQGACGPTGGLIQTDFLIEGEKFDPDEIDHHVEIGAVQQWTLANASGAPHPFHIHVNPFQVVGELVDPNGPDEAGNWMWRDTVAIPPVGSVDIRHRFLHFDGRFVLHCHILNHEDLGMMQIVEQGNPVIDPDTGARLDGDGVGPCEPLDECSL